MTNRPYGLWRDILSFRFEILDSDSPEVVRQKMTDGITDLIGEDEKLAHLMGYLAGFDFVDSPHLSGEPKDVARKGRKAAIEFFRRLTERDPVVIQLEDLHHADDPSLDLLVGITSADEDLPLLLLSMARPALYQRRSTWGSGQDFHVRVDLRPLSKRDSRELVAEILQNVEEVPRELRDLLVERAEGNPYYLEELVKMLVEDRVIQKVDDDSWTIESSRLKDLRVPPTLVGLLQARFDSLLYPEKLTLQRAAVVGRLFYDSAVSALDTADQTHVDDLRVVFKSLTDREFIFPRETSAFAGSREYIFGQAMMRDLILETLLENQTLTYHKAMAHWLTAHGGQRADEYDELIAEHYEEAGEYFLAAKYLAKAERAAFNLGAYPDGIRSGERALDLLTKSDQGPENVQLQLKIQMDLADGHGMQGNYDTTRSLLESALETARLSGDRATEAFALAHLGRMAGTFQQDLETGRMYLEQALAINQELDDKPGLAFILRQLGNLSTFANKPEKSKIHLEESLRLAREIGDLPAVASALDSLGFATFESGDLETALTIFEEALEVSKQLGDSLMEAMVLSHSGHVYSELENYRTVQEIGGRALVIAREANSNYVQAYVLSTLSGAAVGTGQNDIALEYLIESSILALDLGNVYLKTNILLTRAQLQGRLGETKKGLEWLGFMSQKLASYPGGIQRMYARVLTELRGELSDDEVEAALSQGADLKLEDLIAEIIEESV
jgi:predicted ATPase